jgi:membrane protease YdiL (CAAX protease family)
MEWMNKKVADSPYRLAMLGGIVISVVASIAMATIQSWLPKLDSEGLEAVDQLLAGPPVVVAILLFLIVIVSPILEEVFFRKFLWWISSLMFSQTTTLIIISLLFVAAHGSLFHAIGILPITLFFGWLRIKTGSIKHCTVAHIVNNATASVFFLL